MTSSDSWSVQMERLPHRDAIRRLRAAYRLLRQPPQPQPIQDVSSNQAAEQKAVQPVQEVVA